MNTPKLIPLTFSQQRIWFISQLDTESCAYNCPVAIKLEGNTNYQALNTAFLQVIQRHSSLRTNFITQTGTPYQVINQQSKFQLQLVDISKTEPSQINLKIQQQAQQEATTLFDLTKDSLIRGKLLKVSDRENILLVTIHHIIWDYWSWWLLWHEISNVYNAIASKQNDTLKPLAMDYGEYSIWQQQQVTTPEWQEQKAYWSDRFKGEIPLLDLPQDRKRPLVQTYKGASQKISISPNLSKQLQQIVFKTRTSLFIVFIAAYKSWLLRYTNQTDLIVGIPVANRQHLNIKSLIGCFVNTLPIRSNLADNPHFLDLVQQVAQAVLVANENQLYPFEELIKTLNLKRDLSRSPLFQTVFMFREDITKGLNLAGINTEILAISETTAKFDLTVCVYPTSESCQIEFEYNTDLFEAETIQRMMNNFVIFLESIVSQTVSQSLPITQLNLLTQQEKQLLKDWNTTTQEYPNNSCIHHLIETQAAHTPEKIAVVSGKEQLTYRELNQQANQLARYLQQQGVTVNTLVGIALQRSHLFLIALLSVLKAGAAYVPLDPNYPSERLSLMLEDSQLPILLTTADLAETIPNFVRSTINLDTDWAKIEQEATNNPDSPVTPDDLAYIIYTSGSTGKPKGVQLCHRGVVNFLSSMAKEPGITPEDTLLAVTSISFDIAVLELFLPLTVGAKVIIAQDSETNNGIKLLKLIPQAQVTMMQATPATWKMLQAGKWQQIQPLKMLCGGEAMSEELAVWMLENASSVWNVYGPTEATIWATVHQVKPQQTPIPIGKPLANTQIQILDSYGQLVPIGVPGEIHIGGIQLAKGYLNRPELTGEKFIPNPLEFTTKLYKTGDLGRYLNNGTIECLGRLDNQVKVRGFRIELGEIEVNLMLHSAVDNCVVIAREDIPGDKRLVAYLIAQSQPKAAELRAFLAEKLPYYMIPAHFVFLEQFPLTPNGKIDRKVLPAPQIISDRKINQFIAPRNEAECQLAAIWCDLLNVKQVSIEDNFFDLGGHSLLAVSLFQQIETVFQQQLPLATLFTAPTIKQLAQVLETEVNQTQWRSLVAIKPEGSKAPLFSFHALGGNVLNYRQLATYLDAEQPFYALQAPGLDGKNVFNKIEDLASYYIQEMQSVQAKGSYNLTGYSFGALIAYEVARQLEQQGEEIALLAIIDMKGPDSKLNTANWLKFHLHNLAQLEFNEQLDYIRGKVGARKDSKKELLKFIYRVTRQLAKRAGLIKVNTHQQVSQNNRQAWQKYQFPPYEGKVTLFRTNLGMAALHTDNQGGWGQVALGGVEIQEIYGDHTTLFEPPYVQDLAAKLQACLDN